MLGAVRLVSILDDQGGRISPRRAVWGHFLLSLFLVSLFAPPIHAQRGEISGQVLDQAGGSIPDVRLSLLNLSLGLSRELSSAADGSFHFLLLQPGEYVLTAQRDGFGSAEVRDLQLRSDQNLRLRLLLRVGLEPTVVRVSDEEETLFSTSPSLGGTVASDVMRATPLVTRDVTSLALLFPGVLPSPPDQYGKTSYRISGGRVDTVTFLLDDGLDNDLLYNQVAYMPNLDSIAEFRVQTSSYPAEYGRNAGGIISMVTKSGSTEFHGSAFDYFRSDRFNANSFFDNLKGIPRDVYLQNQFGVSLGGPTPFLRGSKKFFYFLSYEGTRQKQGLSNNEVFTYTPAELQGDFSQAGPRNPSTGSSTPNPGVAAFLQSHPYFQPDPVKAAQAIIDPAKIDPVASNYIAAGFIPTSASGYITSRAQSSINADELILKSDYIPSANGRFSLTLGATKQDLLDPFAFANVPGFPTVNQFRGGFFSSSFSKAIGPRLINDLKISADRNDREFQEPDIYQPGAPALGVNIHPDLSTGPALLLFSSGMQVGFGDKGTSRYVSNTYTFSDSISWERGNHHLTSGVGYSIFQNNSNASYLVNGQFVFYGTATSSDLADFLLGMPSAYLQAPNASLYTRSNFVYAFVQNDWKIATNFSVNVGLRYEYSTPKTDTQNRLYSIMPGHQSTVFPNAPVGMVFPGDPGAPHGTNFSDYDNFAPRLSFAWAPRNSQRFRLRGGFGVFYDILSAEDNLQFNGQEPFASSANLFFDPSATPNGPAEFLAHPFQAAGVIDPFPSRNPPRNLNFAAKGLLPIGDLLRNVVVVDPHLQTPYTYQYGLNLQTKLSTSVLLQVGYVGNSAHALTALADVNPMVLGTWNRVLNLTPGNSTCTPTTDDRCSFAVIREFKSLANANFNSLEVLLRKSFSQVPAFGGSYLTLGYTYSHTIDNASGFESRNAAVPAYDPTLFRTSSDSDLRHRLVATGGWTLPFRYYLAQWPSRLTDGWNIAGMLSWRTGFPLDVFANLPSTYAFTSPGPSGAGDPSLVHANLVAPYQTLDPRLDNTFRGVAGNYWFNPGAFSNAQCPSNANGCVPGATTFPNDAQAMANSNVRTYGTLPRNYFRGPGQTNLDLAISKTTPLRRENLSLEARAEMFNALNHVQFANPVTNINDFFFGQVTQTANPRIIQLGLRLIF